MIQAIATAAHASVDTWADNFFTHMLHRKMTTETFETVVSRQWQSNTFLLKAKKTAQRFKDIANSTDNNAHYASDAPHLDFKSQWLIGEPGKPGAIHINAPTERQALNRTFHDLNRKLHCHDSGRIALITSGDAIFHVARKLPNGLTVFLDCPVVTGDLIFWPAWTPHTFDACGGFSLISAMANYVSPAEDGFVYPITYSQSELNTIPRLSTPAYFDTL